MTFHFDHPPRPCLPSPLFVYIRAVVVVVDVDAVVVVVDAVVVVVAIAAAIDNVASFLSLLQMLLL